MEETKDIRNVIMNNQHDDWLHLFMNATLLGISIYIGSFIASKAWHAAIKN